MANLFGNKLSKREIGQRTGSLSQLAGVRLITLEDGVEREIRAVEFRIGNGLRFTVSGLLHSRIGTIPRKLLGYGEERDGGECTLYCEGLVIQATVSGEDLRLQRRFEVKVGSNKIHIKDRVINHVFGRPFALERDQQIWLEDNELRSYHTVFRIHEGVDELAALTKKINSVAQQSNIDYPEITGNYRKINNG
jgi:hypothetical protein